MFGTLTMNAPGKNTLRDPLIEGGIDHQEPNFTANNTIQSWMFHPFDRADAPGALKTLGIAVLTFVGALVNGFFFLMLVDNALKIGASPTTAADIVVRSILIGGVAAVLFFIVKMWTYESLLRHYVYPEIVLGSVVTREIGLFPALAACGILFGGYAAAGGILKAVVTAPEAGLVNGAGVALTTAPKTLLWFGVSFIVFNYLYNMKFHNDDGKRESAYTAARRAAKVTGFAIFAVTVAFANLGLVSYSSGLYVAGVIANGLHLEWAFLVFVPLFASAATGAALYAIFAFLSWGEDKGYGKMKRASGGMNYDDAASRVGGKLNTASSAVRNRKPVQVDF